MRISVFVFSGLLSMVLLFGCDSNNEEEEKSDVGSPLENLEGIALPIDEGAEGGRGKLTEEEVRASFARFCGVVLDSEEEYSVEIARYFLNKKARPSESSISIHLILPETKAKEVFEVASEYLKKDLPSDSYIEERVLDYEMGKFGVGTLYLTRRGENHKRKESIWLDPNTGRVGLSIKRGDV